jgi:hypothetical protein
MVDVSEVKTDGRVPDARLAWPRVAYLSFLMTKFLGAAIPVNANGIDAAHAIFLDDLLSGRATILLVRILTFASRLRSHANARIKGPLARLLPGLGRLFRLADDRSFSGN